MNSKMLSVVGLVATLLCSQAFAASPLLQQLGNTKVGPAIMRELGVTAGMTAADVSAAVSAKWGAAQSIAILSQIDQFNKAAQAPNADGDALATSIFEVKTDSTGKIQLAALSGSSRSNMKKKSASPSCGTGSPAVVLAGFNGITPVLAEAAQEQGILTQENCAIADIQSKPAGRNLGKAVGCMVTNGAANYPVGSEPRVLKGAGCLGGALEPDNTTGPVVPAMKTGEEAKVHVAAFNQISGKGCRYLQ